jgi:hypothetical protein
MPIEVSSPPIEIIRDAHTTYQHFQLLSKLHFNALIETYLRGISIDNIKNQIFNNQFY